MHYWFFAVMVLVGPIVAAVMPGRATAGHRLLVALLLAIWATFSVWGTARAIRWADRHGWDKVP